MKHKFCLLACGLLISLSPTLSGNDRHLKAYLVVWNVGQGQWATWSDATTCFHFDMGGEKKSLRQVKSLCGFKENKIYLSHWDWDHLSFLEKAKRVLPNSCIALAPEGPGSSHKERLLQNYQNCSSPEPKKISIQELTAGLPEEHGKKSSNDLSHVLLVQRKFLIPGDSTIKEEKRWDRFPTLPLTKWLLLGHHGSRTSTSEDLLNKIPQLKVAISSARFAKYGHPHGEVIARLHHHHIPLLRTEDWGNIWFEVNEN